MFLQWLNLMKLALELMCCGIMYISAFLNGAWLDCICESCVLVGW